MLIKLKKGDSLVWECEYTDNLGVPVDLTDYVIKCQARSSDSIALFDLSTETTGITVTNFPDGLFRIEILDTTEWIPKDYKVDIQYTINGIVKSSDTFTLTVLNDETR